MNNDPPIRSTIAKVVARTTDTCIIQRMTNKILFNKAKPLHSMTHGPVVIVPFTCEDAKGMRLDEPMHNRTQLENDTARNIASRLIKALNARGYDMVDFSFRSWTVTVKPTNPVN
jgi:hypothetical protein